MILLTTISALCYLTCFIEVNKEFFLLLMYPRKAVQSTQVLYKAVKMDAALSEVK